MTNMIINLGRQVGSGGLSIASLLSKKLGCEMYDKRILNLAAQESGFSEKFFEQNDEKRSFLQSMCFDYLPLFNDLGFTNGEFSPESLFKFQSEAIQKAAARGNCIFVGRCADYVLRDFSNTLNLFITAPLEERVKRIVETRGTNREEAQRFIDSAEEKRASYYNYYTGKKWGMATSYDLCIDSSILGIEGTADFIVDFAKRRFRI